MLEDRGGRPADWIYELFTRGRVNLVCLPQAKPLDLGRRGEGDAAFLARLGRACLRSLS